RIHADGRPTYETERVKKAPIRTQEVVLKEIEAARDKIEKCPGAIESFLRIKSAPENQPVAGDEALTLLSLTNATFARGKSSRQNVRDLLFLIRIGIPYEG